MRINKKSQHLIFNIKPFTLVILLTFLTGCKGNSNKATSPTLMPTQPGFISTCPMSRPNLTHTPDEHDVPLGVGFGNSEGTLYTVFSLGGSSALFYPGGPGQIDSNGYLEMKWPWYRIIPGELVITGRRLDTPAPPMPQAILRGVPEGYGSTGFIPGTLVFPSEGCWEVTAKVNESSLTFITLVISLTYNPIIWTKWFPEGMLEQEEDITHLPQKYREVFRFTDGRKGEIIIETGKGFLENTGSYPSSAIQSLTVQGKPGICVRGVRDSNGQWQNKANSGVLEWTDGDIIHRITEIDIGLRCTDLLRIVEG